MLFRKPASPSKEFKEIKPMEIAKAILKDMQENLVCLNDYISEDQLPFFEPKKIDEYKEKFGKDKIEHLLGYMKFLHGMRRYADSMAKDNDVLKSLTLAETGVGEHQAMSHYAALKLFEAGCKNVNIIETKGMGPSGNPNDFQTRTVVLIGDISSLKQGSSLADFDKLGEQCILFDRTHNIVAPANQFNALLKNFLTPYNIKEISKIEKAEDILKDIPTLKEQAQKNKADIELTMMMASLTFQIMKLPAETTFIKPNGAVAGIKCLEISVVEAQDEQKEETQPSFGLR